MKTEIQKIGIIISLLFLYQLCFWEELMGINLLLFIIASVAVLWFRHKDKFKDWRVVSLAFCNIFSAVMVAWHNNTPAIYSTFVSSILLITVIHQSQIKSIFTLFIYGLMRFCTVLIDTIEFITDLFAANWGEKPSFVKVHFKPYLLIIPSIIFSIFVAIFASANPIFGEFLENFTNEIRLVINFHFFKISALHIWFLSGGLYIILLIVLDNNILNKIFKIHQYSLELSPSEEPNLKKIQNETKMLKLILISINLLVFIINVIDIKVIWFGLSQDISSAPQLSKLVHQGTYLLIFSILLSIAILLYYFRKDLNFEKQIKPLQNLAYIWLVQNIVLAISVLLRNHIYITSYGLTYKRIGVAVFVLLTIAGIGTIIYKIAKKKSLFFVYQANSLSFYLCFLLFMTVHWDIVIMRYNLNNFAQEKIDFNYLLNLSTESYPELLKHQEKYAHNENVNKQLKQKIAHYLYFTDGFSWLSWTKQRAETKKEFEQFSKIQQ